MVAVAAAAPAAAASVPPTAVYVSGVGTKIVSNKTVAFDLQFVATRPVTVVISAISPDQGWSPLPVVLTVTPGQVHYTFTLHRTDNATGAFAIAYSVDGGPLMTGVVVIS